MMLGYTENAHPKQARWETFAATFALVAGSLLVFGVNGFLHSLHAAATEGGEENYTHRAPSALVVPAANAAGATLKPSP